MNINLDLKLEQQFQIRMAKENVPSLSRTELEKLVLQLMNTNFILKNAFASVVKGEYLDDIDQALSTKKPLL
jgi:hypothetical protein